MSLTDDIMARLPEDRREPFLRIIHTLHIAEDSPDLVQAYLAVEALTPMLAEINYAKGDIIYGMRAAGVDIVSTLAADIADKSVEAIKSGIAGEITQTILPAMQAVSSAHAATLQKQAVAFGGAAVAAAKRLETTTQQISTAAMDVRNQAAALQRLHHRTFLAKFAWAVGISIIVAIITLAGSRFAFYQQCAANIAHTHAYRSTAQRNALIGVYCP